MHRLMSLKFNWLQSVSLNFLSSVFFQPIHLSAHRRASKSEMFKINKKGLFPHWCMQYIKDQQAVCLFVWLRSVVKACHLVICLRVMQLKGSVSLHQMSSSISMRWDVTDLQTYLNDSEHFCRRPQCCVGRIFLSELSSCSSALPDLVQTHCIQDKSLSCC